MALKLTPNLKRELSALAHDLKPVVMIGQNILTDAVIREFENTINHHELIKVKIAVEVGETPAERNEMRKAICQTICEQVPQTVFVRITGNIAIFYKPSPAKKVEAKLKLYRNSNRPTPTARPTRTTTAVRGRR